MTITQLNYIIAVDLHKSFVKAAEHSHVTQSTLSMQIKKLEDSLGVLIFDRSKKPVQLTFIGEQIVKQAKVGITELERIKTIIKMGEQKMADNLKIGILPTLSPYLLPLFLVSFTQKYPSVNVKIDELFTEEIIYQIYNNQLDIGIAVTPLRNPNIIEVPLFYESFLGYVSSSHRLFEKEQIEPSDLETDGFWLLEKGHCFTGQTLKICEENIIKNYTFPIHFECGSLETLRRMVDSQYGYTLLPELATIGFDEEQMKKVKRFKPPVPMRAVSLVFHQSYIRRHTIEVLKNEIQNSIPEHMLQKPEQGKIVRWKT